MGDARGCAESVGERHARARARRPRPSDGVGVVECRAAPAWAASAPSNPFGLALASQRDRCLAATGRDFASQAAFVIARLSPLLSPTSGSIGVILDLGWLMDIVTEWGGRGDQGYPIDTTMAPQWRGATYASFAALVGALRSAAAAAGLEAPRFRVGLLLIGWAGIYQIPSGAFRQRHVEVFAGSGQLHHARAAAGMVGDTYPYAAYPTGVRNGTSFFEFFGLQFASLAAFLGLDALVVRDGFST